MDSVALPFSENKQLSNLLALEAKHQLKTGTVFASILLLLDYIQTMNRLFLYKSLC